MVDFSRRATYVLIDQLRCYENHRQPKPFFAYVRRKRELRQEIESIIVDGVEQTQVISVPPSEMTEEKTPL